jgi:hypothetical protein
VGVRAYNLTYFFEILIFSKLTGNKCLLFAAEDIFF